jgi:hypothetical protein
MSATRARRKIALPRIRRAQLTTAVTVVVLVAAGLGAFVLSHSLENYLILVAIAGFAVVATWRRLGERVLAALCAAIIATLALVSLAVVIRLGLDLASIDGGLPIWLGLGLALLVFTGVAAWYLHGSWLGAPARTPARLRGLTIPSPHWSWKASFICAGSLALALIVGGPLLAAWLQPGPKPVPKSKAVVSQIDVMIVSERPSATAAPAPSARLAPYARSDGLKVRYSVGFADGRGVRWTLTGADKQTDALAALRDPDARGVPAPAPLKDADSVLLLLVDGTPPVVDDPGALPERTRSPDEIEREIARWRAIADGAAPPGTPAYALLDSRPGPRLREWHALFIRRGDRGDAVSAQERASQTVTDTGVRLAIGAPTALQDFSLALKHRPILLFDSREPAPRPLSVKQLFDDGKVKLCHAGNSGTQCAVADPAQLANDDTHLELSLPPTAALQRLARREYEQQQAAANTQGPDDPPPAAAARSTPLGAGSAIYVHPVPVDTGDKSLLYLDYWWYLPYNPARSGSGAFCGPGFVIPGITCFDHVSDWEGVTVVVDRTRPDREPVLTEVHYAQHNKVVPYTWAELQAAWAKDPVAARAVAANGAQRPVVFVAAGTHASYRTSCVRDCRQALAKAEENRHDGGLPWAGNSTPTCGSALCLQPLPTVRGGLEPALWNAFAGPWGARHCFLTYYCDSGTSPAAPASQRRYQRPWNVDKRS